MKCELTAYKELGSLRPNDLASGDSPLRLFAQWYHPFSSTVKDKKMRKPRPAGRHRQLRVEVPQSIKKLLPRDSWRIPAPTAEILPLQAKLAPLLKRAWPGGSEADISGLTADLAGLWEVSRVHIILVRKLVKMVGRLDRRRLQDLSQDFDVNWFSNAASHMKTMKRELARFKSSLYAGDIGRAYRTKSRRRLIK